MRMLFGEHRRRVGRSHHRCDATAIGCMQCGIDQFALRAEESAPGAQPSATRQARAGTERVIHRAVGNADRGADRADRDRGRPRLHRQLFDGIKDLVLVVDAGAWHCSSITERSLCYLDV